MLKQLMSTHIIYYISVWTKLGDQLAQLSGHNKGRVVPIFLFMILHIMSSCHFFKMMLEEIRMSSCLLLALFSCIPLQEELQCEEEMLVRETKRLAKWKAPHQQPRAIGTKLQVMAEPDGHHTTLHNFWMDCYGIFYSYAAHG